MPKVTVNIPVPDLSKVTNRINNVKTKSSAKREDRRAIRRAAEEMGQLTRPMLLTQGRQLLEKDRRQAEAEALAKKEAKFAKQMSETC